jgi:hypothetical protein
MEFDWHKCRFLESADNLKRLTKVRTGRSISSAIAREIVACVQQGRLFYEAAASAPLEIRPLQQFYGMIGFAKALVASHRMASLSTLCAAHGLSDISASNSRIPELTVRLGSAGTFQEFNDVVAELNRLCCYGGDAMEPYVIRLPTAKSHTLLGLQLTLRDLLSRIPDMESLYEMTFEAAPDLKKVGVFHDSINPSAWEVTVQGGPPISDREAAREVVRECRHTVPFLQSWRLKYAARSYGETLLTFMNVEATGIDDLSEEWLPQHDGYFEATEPDRPDARFPVENRFNPLAGGYSGLVYAITPVATAYLSEYSLHYLALFLLSSLVRYRPQVWAHAISRSATAQQPAGDEALSLVERFLELNRFAIPSLTVQVLNPHEDRYNR